MGQTDGYPSRVRFTKKVLVATLLVAVIVGSLLVYVYYWLGMASVTGVRIDEVFADRNYVAGIFPHRNATFFVEVQVSSKNQALSVRLDNPVFLVDLAPDVRGHEMFASGTILPGAYLSYNLRLSINESIDFGTISFPNATVSVVMSTSAGAGFYSQTVNAYDCAIWDWTTATLIKSCGGGLR